MVSFEGSQNKGSCRRVNSSSLLAVHMEFRASRQKKGYLKRASHVPKSNQEELIFHLLRVMSFPKLNTPPSDVCSFLEGRSQLGVENFIKTRPGNNSSRLYCLLHIYVMSRFVLLVNV
jgi:hypothetical protein